MCAGDAHASAKQLKLGADGTGKRQVHGRRYANAALTTGVGGTSRPRLSAVWTALSAATISPSRASVSASRVRAGRVGKPNGHYRNPRSALSTPLR